MRTDDTLQALFDPGSASNFFEGFSALGAVDPRQTTAHSPGNALWLAEFCRLVYRDNRSGPPDRESFIASLGWRERGYFDKGGTQAGLYVNDTLRCGILAFRGTSQLADAIVDSLALLAPWDGHGLVHIGFRKALDQVWEDVRAALRDITHPFFLTGHSLGAALATLSAARCLQDHTIHSPAALYTIGSPRVGNSTFVATLKGLHHSRIVNDEDVVPRVPPVLATVPFAPVPVYQHGGELHHIQRDGHIEIHAPDSDVRATAGRIGVALQLFKRTVRDLETAMGGNWQGPLPASLSDHAPINYVYRLQDALSAGE